MRSIRKFILLTLFLMGSAQLMAQNATEMVVQNLQTANFNSLLSYWDNQVEVTMPDMDSQIQYNAREANEILKTFFNKKNILGFEKNAARQVGSTVYLTGKLLSSNAKYSITLLLQQNKNNFSIVSVRVN
jgi:Domain of unknown function (DUF4783)